MEYQLLMTAIVAISEQLTGWLRAAQEIEAVENAGGTVSGELREKARQARKAAQAVMEVTP